MSKVIADITMSLDGSWRRIAPDLLWGRKP
jgi:hypothetical protein